MGRRGYDDNRHYGRASGTNLGVRYYAGRQSFRVVRCWPGGTISPTWRRHTMVFGVAFRPSAPVPSVVAGLCVFLSARRPVVHGHRGSPDGDGDTYADGADRTFGATVRHCLAGVDPFLPCVNERAMAALELAESEDSMSLGSDLEMTVTAPEDLAPKGVYSIGKPAGTGPSRLTGHRYFAGLVDGRNYFKKNIL